MVSLELGGRGGLPQPPGPTLSWGEKEEKAGAWASGQEVAFPRALGSLGLSSPRGARSGGISRPLASVHRSTLHLRAPTALTTS